MQAFFIIAAFAAAVELGLHIIYFAWTGRAGLNDPPFDYLKRIFRRRK